MTILLILLTVLVSYQAFNDPTLRAKLIFNPWQIKHRNEPLRFITHGFIHADWQHLIFNMYALYIFGGTVEAIFEQFLFGGLLGKVAYVIFYLAAIVAASYPDYVRHQDNMHYNALGASGGVAATIWPYIMLAPWNWFIFPPLPAILLGIGYIVYSSYMDRQARGNVAHGAHLWGAVFGLVVYVTLISIHAPELVENFLVQLMQPQGPAF